MNTDNNQRMEFLRFFFRAAQYRLFQKIEIANKLYPLFLNSIDNLKDSWIITESYLLYIFFLILIRSIHRHNNRYHKHILPLLLELQYFRQS